MRLHPTKPSYDLRKPSRTPDDVPAFDVFCLRSNVMCETNVNPFPFHAVGTVTKTTDHISHVTLRHI